ncbi:hypothetical protein L484_024887 [Morus notabilis]|uniref:DUF632 domain-containing protein n=1 Tax=Morus notabilis TaxID=981085 RepID=W9RJ78_9ROSA|nr:nitrate regulatory gene2 protein [Morus notabilis]EXB56345.1 hypothetical protein L484_024887 [Morus notabilis]
MGCANSKLDDLPAVALCRDRCKYLDEALRHSHTFSDAHAGYLDSLKTLGPTLNRFFAHNADHHQASVNGAEPPKPSPPPEKSRSDSVDDGADKDRVSFLTEDETQGLITHNFGFSSSVNGGSAPSKPPPSPPPASIGSAWDFLNLFDTFERYERLYISNSESELRESTAAADKVVKPEGSDEKTGAGKAQAAEDGKTATYEVPVVENKMKEETAEKASDSAASATPLGVSEALNLIQVLFVQASESGNGVLNLLYYRQRMPLNQDSFRLCFEEDMGISPRNLSSTLKKLLLWEKKLYCEVKAEEKLRIIHQRKLQELKYLDKEGGNKAQKANSTRALLRDLTTKLNIAFQIVDRISIAINKLRDEEFWPQIMELNHRLLQMWKAMLECHKSQYQAVAEAKGLDAITYDGKLNNADLKAAIQLKLELQTWNLSFSNWVFTQKDYVKSLNGWLVRCLLYEPEETPDGLIPFSPGRLGAPPVFVILNHWSHAMDTLSEAEVIGAIQGFLAAIDLLLKEHNVDLQQIVIADKEIEKKVKILEREEQKMQKLMQGREKNMVISVGHTHQKGTSFVNHSEIIRYSNLQLGLKQIFLAMEKFMQNSMHIYEELRIRIEEVSEHALETQTGA